MNIYRRLGLLVPCLLLSLLFWDRPELLINADQLLPAAFTWDLLHHSGVWQNFQHARVLSLIPDLLVFGLVQAVTDNWRLAYALWIFVVISWLVGISGVIVKLITQFPIGTSALAALLVVALVLIGSLLVRESSGAVLIGGQGSPWGILLPFNHGGPFLLTLTAAVIAAPTIRRMTGLGLVSLFLLSAAGVLSDLLYVGLLLIPLTAALLGRLYGGMIEAGAVLQRLAAAWGGGLLGWAGAAFLPHQPTPFPPLDAIPWHVASFLMDLGSFPVLAVLLDGVILTIAYGIWRRGPREWLISFWPVFAATSVLGSLGLTVLLYQDPQSYRYAMACLWWFAILAATKLAKLCARLPAAAGVAAVVLSLGLALAYPVTRWHTPGLLVWESPLATCLQRAGLRTGLAEFWHAGTTAASSNWRIQVEQLTPSGAARPWGSDPRWFTHDIHDWSRRPQFNFIVMDGLLADRIAAAYGGPNRVLMCGQSEVWIYDDPDRLYQNLVRASPHAADLFATRPHQ